MSDLSDLKRYLSGGAANTTADASLGGAISTTGLIKNQTATRSTSLITGVTIDDALGNAIGSGTLTFAGAAKTLSWTPPNSTAGTAVDVSSSGTYAIQGPSNGGMVIVTVVASSLPGSNVSDTVVISALNNQLWDDVSKAQSNAGEVTYRCFYFKNAAADTMVEFKLWIAENTPGQDSVAIGLDPAGIGGTATQTTKAVTGATWLSSVSTFTCTGHGIPVGAKVTVAGVTPSGYNGDYTVTAVTENTFSVADASDPGSFSVAGTVCSETFAPAGVTFSLPSASDPLSVGDLDASESQAVWVRRTVPAGVTVATASNGYKLGYSVKV